RSSDLWAAAACRARPSARRLPGGDLRRRTDRQPRLPLRCRGSRLAEDVRTGDGADGGHGDSRPDRRVVRRPRRAARRRPDRRRPHQSRPEHHRRGGRRPTPSGGPMRISVLRSQLIDARQHPARVVLTGLAIIIAAFVVFGTVLASDITRRTILDNFSGTPAAVDLVIRDGSLDTMAALRSLPEVAEVAVRTELYLPFADEVNRGLTLISDPGNGPLSTVTVTSGRYPQKDTEIAVSELTAERTGLAEGRSVRVVPAQLTDGPPPDPITLTVVGVVSAADDFGGTAFTTEDAIGLLAPGWEGLPRLDLRLTAGTDAEAARATVTRA